jgi:hypothetical protein
MWRAARNRFRVDCSGPLAVLAVPTQKRCPRMEDSAFWVV